MFHNFFINFKQVSRGQYNGLVRNNGHPLYNIHRDLGLSCSCEDLVNLVALVRALEEKECCSAGHAPSGGLSNAEDLIMNLVNALIQLTTQALSHNCHCPNQSGNNYPPHPGNGGSGNYYPNHNGGSDYSHSDGGLLNLNILDSTKKGNLLNLDVAKEHLLSLGLGGDGGSSQGSNGHYNSNGRNANGGKDDGLIEVDLANRKNSNNNNLVDVNLGNQHLVGVSLGGGGSSSTPSQTTYTNNKTGSSGKGSNSGENNIAEVNLAGQTIVSVGLGSNNGGAVNDKS
ncbi:N66 matrix protein-like isoform X2 [Maniola jurtina]|uniref:N66 matrix protein-like isoform X2 n=1 Tax=Maniola jurtina TaxID=191418 RepID=UPI001E68A27B|nr:N66 matrix protein-like isoform X2 [Maniola jurtina]